MVKRLGKHTLFFLAPVMVYLFRYFADQPLLWAANVLFAAIFCWMIAEDLFYRTVDIRAVLLLGNAAVLVVLMSGQSLSGFVMGGFTGLFFSLCIFVAGLHKPSHAKHLASSINKNLQVGFLPSLGIALVIWTLWVMDSLKFWVLEFIHVEEMAWIVGALFGFILLFKRFQLSNYRWRELKSGFGGGDVLVCTILSAYLGWQGFYIVFFIALWVHLAVCLLLLAVEKAKIKEG